MFEQHSFNTGDNNASQESIKTSHRDSKSIMIPRAQNNDFIKVTESFLLEPNRHHRSLLGKLQADRTAQGTRKDSRSHQLSKALLPGLSPDNRVEVKLIYFSNFL